MATVEGDIHDIGKNIVGIMLENYGFKVVDLGKDVPASRILAAAQQHQAAIIGLSALMTTTMPRMPREVIAGVKEMQLDCRVMVGGAVCN
ncbi:MAG: cobalamin-dependent protein [Syntrophomonadaceae bacterium]